MVLVHPSAALRNPPGRMMPTGPSTAAGRLAERWARDFSLGPGSDAQGLQALAGRLLAAREADRPGIADELCRTPAVTTAIAQAAYVRILRRLPDAQALKQAAQALASGINWTAVAADWLGNAEYFAQRAHETNALFVTTVFRDLMLEPEPGEEARVEESLGAGAERPAVVREIIERAERRGALAALIGLRLGLPGLGGSAAGPARGGAQDPLRDTLVAVLASEDYLTSADTHPSARAAVADALAHRAQRLAGPAGGGNPAARRSLADALETELAEKEFAAGAVFRWMAAQDGLVAGEVRRGILPALTTLGVPEKDIAALAALPDAEARAFLGEPLARAIIRLIGQHPIETGAQTIEKLGHDGGLLEHWEARLRPFVAAIVQSWWTRLALPPDDRARSHWTERLLANEYYFAVLAELLSSAQALGAEPAVFFDGTLSIGRPAGSCIALEASRLAAVPAESRMRFATTFFYWYDVYYNRNLLSSPDDLAQSDDKLALTVKPPTLEDFSYLSFAWNRKEIGDMQHAGIDVVMPVYYGTPLSDPIQIANPHDAARNIRNNFAEPGLRMIRRALDDIAGPPMRVAMFYDSTTTNRVNAKAIQLDFRFNAAYDWFYETIRSFFSHVPRKMWALREGRPIILVYHPCFGVNLTRKLYPYVRFRFKADFGLDPFIVTAAEEEAPRVLQNEYVARIARTLTYDNWRDRLADLLADPPLFEVARRNDQAFAEVLLEALLGQAGGVPAHMPRVDFPRPSGGVLSSSEAPAARASESETGIQTVARLVTTSKIARTVMRGSRRNAALEVLASPEFIDWQVRDLLLRYLRVREAEYGPGHRQLAASLKRHLADGKPWAAALQMIFETPEFAAAAGGEDRVIDLIYQLLVWRCPNPDYVNNHTTVDDAGKREFLARAGETSKGAAIRWFLERFEVAEAVASDWLYKFYGWYNPGIADSSFYWGGAIAPMVRDVAAVGPGYDQGAIKTRAPMCQPRHGGQRYRDVLGWIASMSPRPWLLHLETWNEFFEGSTICDCEEYGRQYIEITREATRGSPEITIRPPVPLPAPARATPRPSEYEQTRREAQMHERAGFAEGEQASYGAGGTSAQRLAEVFAGRQWHQRWEVEPGIFTPGGNDVLDIMRWSGVPKSLAGKRVLDIGAWNGCCSFECERRGAAEVIAIGPENPDHAGFNALKAYLGSKVEYRLGTIYDLQPDKIGTFDVVLCFGVLYHLRHPLLGLDMIRRVCRGDLHLETYATPDQPNWPKAPVLEFFRKDELNRDPSNWFSPNAAALDAMLRSAGFETLTLTQHPNNRAAAHARVIPGPPEWMTMGTGEGFYYDVITRPVLGRPDVY